MKVLDSTTAAAERTNALLSKSNSQLDFTRAQFATQNGRIHTESRCNQCNFRITATTSDAFDNEEREHARTCRGSEAE